MSAMDHFVRETVNSLSKDWGLRRLQVTGRCLIHAFFIPTLCQFSALLVNYKRTGIEVVRKRSIRLRIETATFNAGRQNARMGRKITRSVISYVEIGSG